MRAAAGAAEEEQVGRGMVPEDRGRDLGWAAEEWAEAEAGRDRARAEEEREPAAREEAVVRVRAADCGNRARAAGRDPVGLDLVAAQVRGADREVGEADPAGRAEVAPAEVGERVADRVGVAAPEAGALVAHPVEGERLRVWAEGVSAEVAQVRVEVEQDLAVAQGVVREAEELVEEELGRAERGGQENG